MGTATFVTLAPAATRPTGDTDHDLIARVRAGDDAAFATLYERYHRRIAAYIYGMVKDYGRAEDIAQDVFMSALRRMRETDRPIAFKPWIYEIAKNACIDQFRRSRRAEEVSYDAEEGLGAADYGRLVTTGPTPDVAVDQKMSLDHLRGAFGGLSETHHEILVMRELEGLSYREIGEKLGMSRPSVESTLFRARRRLAEEYEELVSGERCLRVQSIIAGCGASSGSSLGARDRRRMAAHVSHCQPCRRHARVAGIDPALLQVPKPVRAKIAALVPLPAFLRNRWGGSSDAASGVGTHAAQWVPQLNALSDPAVASWAKAVAAAATIAVAGLGADAATRHASQPTSHGTTRAVAGLAGGGASGGASSKSSATPTSKAGRAAARRAAAAAAAAAGAASGAGHTATATATAAPASGGKGGSGGGKGGLTGGSGASGKNGGPSSAPAAPTPGDGTQAAEIPLGLDGVINGGGNGSGGGSGTSGDQGSADPVKQTTDAVDAIINGGGSVGDDQASKTVTDAAETAKKAADSIIHGG